jgi:valyl-tRNA synthetase
VLDGTLRLLHPIMPFVTEEVWHALNETAPTRGLDGNRKPSATLAIAPWDLKELQALADKIAEPEAVLDSMKLLQDVVRSIRNIRAEFGVDAKADVDVVVECSPTAATFLGNNLDAMARLAKVRTLKAEPSVKRPDKSASNILPTCKVFVPLAEFIDVPSEIAKQTKRLAEMKQRLVGVQAKLSNEKFVGSAPAEIVDQQRQLATDLESQIAAVELIVADLKA